MIILKQIGTYTGGGCAVVSTAVSGVQNNSNQTFTTELEYVPERITVDYNGQSLSSPEDFIEINSNTFEFIYLKPGPDDNISATYETTECDFGAAGVEYFTELLDTPTSFTGHGGDFVKVKSGEDGLEFAPLTSNSQEGIKTLTSGVCSEYIAFPQNFTDSNYVLNVSLENTTDPHPNIYPFLITDKTTSGFYVEFAGYIESSNYKLNWQATASGSNFGGTSINYSSQSFYPVLGATSYEIDEKEETNDINLGNGLIMTSVTISGGHMHGYTVGWSGEAVEMAVQRNDSGFGCPLYMKSNGMWFQCTAISGTNQMPCMALALEEGEGSRKKILWKGNVRKDVWNWTPGDIIYVSTVAGALTNEKPNDGAWEQAVGIALKNNIIRFDPGFNPGNKNN